MRRVYSKQALASVILSFLALFLNGLWNIRADNNIYNQASLLLISIQLLIFLTLSFFGYFILRALRDLHKRLIMIAAGIIYMALWFYLLFDYILPPSYSFFVVNGRYLADNYGINWFWMDWGVWVQCITVYALGFYLYLVSLVLDTFSNSRTLQAKKK